MPANLTFPSYLASLRGFIGNSSDADAPFNELALALFTLQFQHNLPYARFCRNRGRAPAEIDHWSEIPAIPAGAFKELELSCLPPADRPILFRSSGTTGHQPSRHFHNPTSLALYEDSLTAGFKAHLLPDSNSLQAVHCLCLTPPPEQAPHSSLVHMFHTLHRRLPFGCTAFTGSTDSFGAWLLNLDRTTQSLQHACQSLSPVLLLGTAFSFVHLTDHLEQAALPVALPAGSAVMETGGYKGRSRELTRTELHQRITRFLQVPPDQIVREYGMSELSSQAYDRVAGPAPSTPSCRQTEPPFRFPPWARSRIVSPETGREVRIGDTGLIQIFDLANAYSVLALQTEDLGIRREHGFDWFMRVPQAEPRGCSLMTP